MGALFRIRCIQVAKTRRCHHSVSELRVHGGFAGMESAQSEDNLEGKVGGSIPSPSPALNVMANSSRAYSSDDLRSMGAPTSGPSGMPGNSLLTHQTHCSSDPTPWVGLNSDAVYVPLGYTATLLQFVLYVSYSRQGFHSSSSHHKPRVMLHLIVLPASIAVSHVCQLCTWDCCTVSRVAIQPLTMNC